MTRPIFTRLLLYFSFTLLYSLSINAAEITYGDAITGTIVSAGELHTYTFNGKEGDIILIRMRGVSNGGVDACLRLLDPSGNLIQEDCDDGGLVKIDGFKLPVTGTYTIESSDHNDNDTGVYGLSLEKLNGGSYADNFDCSKDLTASLEHLAEMKSYNFKADEGDRIRVQMRSASGGLESELTLYDESGAKVVDGVRVSGLNTIEDLVLTNSGVFTLIAKDGNGNDMGSFGLSLEFLSSPECGEPLACGDFKTTLTNMAEMDAFHIKASQGDHIIVDVSDNNNKIEPIIRFYDADGNLLESIKSMTNSAQLEINAVQADGDYKLLISDEKGNDTGDLNIQVQFVGNGCNESIVCDNESRSDKLEYAGDINNYEIVCVAGDILTIQMRAVQTTIEPQLTLKNPDGSTLATTHSNGSLARLNEILITEDGTYSIDATDKGGNDFGVYGISVQNVASTKCATYLGCDFAFHNGQLDHFAEMDAYSFKAETGQILTVVMEEVDVAIEPEIKLYSPSGTMLSGQARSYHADVTNFILPEEGEYILLALDKNGNDTGAYTIDFNLSQSTGQSVCVSCNDGVQNGDEEGLDCGGAYCEPCCPDNSITCVSVPSDLTIACSELEGANTGFPKVIAIKGEGTYDMTITFDGLVETGGNCSFDGIDIFFNNACQGVRTACFGDVVKLTSDSPTCLGPLPKFPFIMYFGDHFKVSVDINGTITNIGNEGSSSPALTKIKEWLTSASPVAECGDVSIFNDFNVDLFSAGCNPNVVGTHTVTFEAIDHCGQGTKDFAMLTVIDDITPPCPDAGTTCDDGNDATINDVEDGDCNCQGEEVVEDCPTLVFSEDAIDSYGVNQDAGTAQVLEDGAVLHVTGNGWKSVPFDYEITSETVLEFDFKSTIEGEIHGIGFDADEAYNSNLLFNLFGSSSWGINAFTDYPGDGEYKHYIIPVGQYIVGTADRMTFIADHDAWPRDGNSFFKNVKVYEETCGTDRVICGTGTISRDVWKGIAGYPLSTVPWNTIPDESDEVNVFEIPTDAGEHYGTRLRGYICPPQTGNYTFWISSDDFGELWLSKDDDRDNINLIANVPGWTMPRVWDKYPEQKSVEVYLEEGQRYYVEAYMKEHQGLDNLAVGWQMPDGTLERPIVGTHLSPWDGPMINRINPTVNLDSSASLRDGEEESSAPSLSDHVGFEVYPNPVSEVLHIVVPEFIGKDVSVQLYNNLGQVTLTKEWTSIGSPNLKIDLQGSTVGKGYYNLVVRSGDKMLSKPVIVMK